MRPSVATVYNRFPTHFDEHLPVEVDIETNGLNPFRPEAKIHCMALAQNPQEIYWVRVRKDNIPMYRDFFTRFKIISRRGTFEGSWIYTQFGVMPKLYFDTKVGAFLIDENDETGLKDEAVYHLKVPYWDDIMNFQHVTDWGQMKRYNSRDVMYDLRLYQERHLPYLKQHPKIAKLAKYILIPAIETFTKVICDGFNINTDLAIERLDECKEKLIEFNGEINAIAGRYVNPGSPKQMVQLLYEDLGLRCPVKTKKGNKSSSEAALIRLMGKHPIIDHTLEWRKWKKYDSTYLTPWIRKGPVLHANYGFTDTDTGRLNSTMVKNKRGEKKLGATLHQCPRDHFIRNLITARSPDSVIVAADLSQIELRLVAHAASEPTMIRIFNRGEDIHLSTAQTLTTDAIIDKETRKKAKAVNFGFVYGMWAKKFVAYAKEKFALNLSQHDGEKYREAFFDKYAGLLLWHSRVEHFVSQNGWIDSVFGRRRHLPGAKYGSGLEEWMRREAVRQGINSPIQSAGSDLNLFINNLISSRQLPWEFKIDPSKCFMVGSAHDSQIFECNRDYVQTLKAGFKYTLDHLPQAVDRYFGFCFKVPILMDVVAYEDCWEGEEMAA
jgi:DNA polymerase I-like protein with 3'-5' exonuclease and polymerase domains